MIVLTALLLAGGGFPEAPPWGHAGQPGTDDCTACHWDNDAQPDSPRVLLEGLPDHFIPGESYELIVRLADADEMNGFQLVTSSGEFDSPDRSTRSRDAGARSTRAAGEWAVTWIAGDSDGPVTFWLAINDANGDGSEFGDTILLQTFEVLR